MKLQLMVFKIIYSDYFVLINSSTGDLPIAQLACLRQENQICLSC